MTEPSENLATAKRYLKAIESGAGGDEIVQFFAPEAIVEIYPSLYFPHASRSDLAGIRTSADCGRQVMTSQKYQISLLKLTKPSSGWSRASAPVFTRLAFPCPVCTRIQLP